MKQTLETNRIITGSLFIIATIAVSFILNFAQPFFGASCASIAYSYIN